MRPSDSLLYFHGNIAAHLGYPKKVGQLQNIEILKCSKKIPPYLTADDRNSVVLNDLRLTYDFDTLAQAVYHTPVDDKVVDLLADLTWDRRSV